MSWVTGTAVFLVIWWLVIFMVLPWGNQPIDRHDVDRGHAPSAPKKPRLIIKLAITTVVSAILWGAVFLILDAGWITLR